MTEKPGFRPAMNWLHTWAGLTLGTLLFTIWWMGTLSVFDQEIDRWMKPETRLAPASQTLDADAVISRVMEKYPGDELESFLIYLPRERKPFFEVYGELKDSGRVNERLHAVTGEPLGESRSRAASGFFYPMHYRLHMGGIGYFIVAFATLYMMVLLVTGVVIHRKIFVDFFTFRPKKKIRRSSLDLHNVTGVMFLPFHFLICLSGFAIFPGFYASPPFAIAKAVSESNETVKLFYAASDYAYYRREPAGEPAKMADIAPFVARAEAIWTERYDQPAKADRIDLHHVGDKNAYVEVRRFFPSRRMEAHRDSINFDGVNGEILMDFEASPVGQARNWLEGFHQIQFDHWPLRWFYFIAGLAGCILIATGFLFWTASRMKKGAVSQPVKIRFVEAMSVGSVTGMIVATGAFLVANRLLPAEAAWAGLARPELEVRIFFLVWVLSFVHPVIRSNKAWAEQSWAIAALGVLAVILNWVTTGDHLFASASRGLWSVAGMDLVLLASAGAAALAAMRLQQRPDSSATMRRKPDASKPVDATKPSPVE